MIKEIEASGTPLARYVARFFQPGHGADYMWDELAAAAWIDPALITRRETRYIGVDLDRGAGYGNTLTWSEKDDRGSICSRSKSRWTWIPQRFIECL